MTSSILKNTALSALSCEYTIFEADLYTQPLLIRIKSHDNTWATFPAMNTQVAQKPHAQTTPDPANTTNDNINGEGPIIPI